MPGTGRVSAELFLTWPRWRPTRQSRGRAAAAACRRSAGRRGWRLERSRQRSRRRPDPPTETESGPRPSAEAGHNRHISSLHSSIVNTPVKHIISEREHESTAVLIKVTGGCSGAERRPYWSTSKHILYLSSSLLLIRLWSSDGGQELDSHTSILTSWFNTTAGHWTLTTGNTQLNKGYINKP